ncbi:MAG TPA: class I SAM-dependent methyltransferase [Verrucomicrobiaceae bacterium]
MLAPEYDTMRQVEDSYWWYAVLRGAVVDEVRRLSTGIERPRIMDAGCGTGGTLARLREADPSWDLRGIDFSPHAVEHTRARGIAKVEQGDVAHLPVADGALDGIVSLDVLYHANVDEPRAVAEFHRALRPDGFLILNLPAFDLLTGSHDKAVGGVRRYTKERLRALLEPAGFRMDRRQYWNAWLFPAIGTWRVLSRIMTSHKTMAQTKSDLSQLPAWLNTSLAAIGRTDFALSRAMALPFGTSVFATARKRAA